MKYSHQVHQVEGGGSGGSAVPADNADNAVDNPLHSRQYHHLMLKKSLHLDEPIRSTDFSVADDLNHRESRRTRSELERSEKGERPMSDEVRDSSDDAARAASILHGLALRLQVEEAEGNNSTPESAPAAVAVAAVALFCELFLGRQEGQALGVFENHFHDEYTSIVPYLQQRLQKPVEGFVVPAGASILALDRSDLLFRVT